MKESNGYSITENTLSGSRTQRFSRLDTNEVRINELKISQ